MKTLSLVVIPIVAATLWGCGASPAKSPIKQSVAQKQQPSDLDIVQLPPGEKFVSFYVSRGVDSSAGVLTTYSDGKYTVYGVSIKDGVSKLDPVYQFAETPEP